jgi:cytidylate kinase
MIITIDGPAGAGKSSAARGLARRLGFDFLDTGAMYRAVALAALRTGTDLADAKGLAAVLANLQLEVPPGRVVLNGEDVTAVIRTREMAEASSAVAAVRVVREYLVERQRAVALGRNFVCEGRDQGTVVFPDAACKFFLVADPVERARRRQRDLAAQGRTVSLEDLLHDQEVRDRRDAERDVAPMKPAADAILLDSTSLTLDEVIDRMEREVRCKSGSASSGTGSAGTSPPPP